MIGSLQYDYSDAELSELAVGIKAMAQRVPAVHAILNNNFEDQGQRNALTLSRPLATS